MRTRKQVETIERVRAELRKKIDYHRERFGVEKEITEFWVHDLGINNIKVLNFTTNRTDGNIMTQTHGHLYIGTRGGLKGTVETFGNQSRVNSSSEFFKVAMWV